MARKSINTGTGINTYIRESLRSAMTKINDNFDELYTRVFGSDSSVSQIVATTITAQDTNGSLTLTVNGSGEIILDGTVIIDQEIKSSGSSGVTVGDDLTLKGSLRFGADGNPVNIILDEDNMASNSATALATQQSIRAFVNSQIGASSTLKIDTDDSGQINLDIANENLSLVGDESIDVTASGNTITVEL